MDKRVIVALDLDTRAEILNVASKLSGSISTVKIGSKAFTKYGMSLIDDLADLDFRVFLDLKFHDIPSVVKEACKIAAGHSAVELITVHASGGPEMVRAACEGVLEAGPIVLPKIVAVTALTSFEESSFQDLLGTEEKIEDWALRLARISVEAGAEAIVCSPHEVSRFRAELPENVELITPGIRLSSCLNDDQTRVMTPSKAIASGSDRLVIGRPIYQHPEPERVLQEILSTLP